MAYTTPPRFIHVLTYKLSLRQRPRCSKRRRISMVRSSRSLTWPRSLSHTLCLSLLLAHSLTFCLFYLLTHSKWSRSLPHTLCLALSLSCSLPPSLTHSHPPFSTHSPTQSLTHSPTHSLHALFLSPSVPLSPLTLRSTRLRSRKSAWISTHTSRLPKSCGRWRRRWLMVTHSWRLRARRYSIVARAHIHTHTHTHTHTLCDGRMTRSDSLFLSLSLSLSLSLFTSL